MLGFNGIISDLLNGWTDSRRWFPVIYTSLKWEFSSLQLSEFVSLIEMSSS
jgi:hypothetical protein